MKITLGEALDQADEVSIDGYEMERYRYPPNDAHLITLERADEEAFDFESNAWIELDDGEAYVLDTDGDEHHFIFCVHRRLGT